MPACPNCGRATLRTRDWACQWCGYPLLSRAYKKIDKTFKELQEERSSSSVADTEPPPISRVTYEPPPQPPSIEPPPRPEQKSPPPATERKPPPAAPPEPAPVLRPEAELPSPPLPVSIAPPPPAPEPLPPPPAPVVLPDLNTVADGSLLTVDELDALYKADRLAAHARLANKTIRVKGFVEKVFIRDHIDVRYIMLTGVNKKLVWPVRCTFSRESIAQMGRLSEGQEVTVRGKYDSYSKNIIFKDCVLAV